MAIVDFDVAMDAKLRRSIEYVCLNIDQIGCSLRCSEPELILRDEVPRVSLSEDLLHFHDEIICLLDHGLIEPLSHSVLDLLALKKKPVPILLEQDLTLFENVKVLSERYKFQASYKLFQRPKQL